MSIARLVAGVLVAASVAFAAEARATECVDPAACFCETSGEIVEAFSGTIVPGTAAAGQVQVRIDSDHPTGAESWLEVGDTVALPVTAEEGTASNGARLLGMTVRTCGGGLPACGDLNPTTVGFVRIIQIIRLGELFTCGENRLSASPDVVATAMASSSCESKVHDLFLSSGVESTCVRSGDCSMHTGPASSGGLVALLGAAALIARRRRRARSASIA